MESPQPTTHKGFKNKGEMIAGIAVLVIAVVGYGFLAKANRWWPHGQTQIDGGSLLVPQSASDADISSKQTYRSDKYAFEITYPKVFAWYGGGNYPDSYVGFGPKGHGSSIYIESGINLEGCDKGLSSCIEVHRVLYTAGQNKAYNLSYSTINGYAAATESITLFNQYYRTYYFLNNGYFSSVQFSITPEDKSEFLPVFEQILSTFRFIEPVVVEDNKEMLQLAANGTVYHIFDSERFGFNLDITKYPIRNIQITCSKGANVGYVSNWSVNGPDNYPIGYEASGNGTCTWQNGNYKVTIEIADLPY